MIGALGNVTTEFDKLLEKLETPCNVIATHAKDCIVRNSKDTKMSFRNVNNEEGHPVSSWSLVVTRRTGVITVIGTGRALDETEICLYLKNANHPHSSLAFDSITT